MVDAVDHVDVGMFGCDLFCLMGLLSVGWIVV